MEEDEVEWNEERIQRVTEEITLKFRKSFEQVTVEEKKEVSKGCGIKNTLLISPENLAKLTVEMKMGRSKMVQALHIAEQILLSS